MAATTLDNLQTAFDGESNARAKYLEFAKKADTEGYAKAAVLPFASGGGIRFMTEYAQYTAAVNNHDLFYTYQGVTSDGQYWVTVILPITHPILPVNSENPPGGMTWEDFSNNYEPYITDMVNQLNAQPDDSYFPTLTLMDALAASITITP